MSESKFRWESDPEPEEWDRLVDLSPQGTLFCERLYLELAGVAYRLFLIKQGAHTKAGVVILPGPNGKSCRLDDLVIHNGLLFLPDPQKKPVKQRFEQFGLTEFVIKRLTDQFDTIELALAPQFEDLRPFLWHDYHDSNGHFLLDLRYTSYVDISSLDGATEKEQTVAFRSMEALRQRHIREAAKNGATVRRGEGSRLLIEYYRQLMLRQEERPSEEKLTCMERLVDGSLMAGRGAIYEVLNRAGVVIYVVVYGWDPKRAYYLFGAGHPEVSEPWQGTLAHWEAFKDLAQRLSIKEVDLEGVNSPKRGWFKLGFGGDLRPYYHVFKRNSV